MQTSEVASLVRKHLGREPGRIRLPGTPIAYDERREVTEVTPLQAMRWIAATWERYPDARNFYPTKIEKIVRYANDMSSGHWEYRPQGDPIVITDGIVTGGRHRLHAILLSHTTQRCNVTHKTTKKDQTNV